MFLLRRPVKSLETIGGNRISKPLKVTVKVEESDGTTRVIEFTNPHRVQVIKPSKLPFISAQKWQVIMDVDYATVVDEDAVETGFFSPREAHRIGWGKVLARALEELSK